jgi:hypothetical protein
MNPIEFYQTVVVKVAITILFATGTVVLGTDSWSEGRTLTPQDTARLVGGVDDRVCDINQSCHPNDACKSLSFYQCVLSNSTSYQAIAGAADKDCITTLITYTCTSSTNQDCAEEFSCSWDNANSKCFIDTARSRGRFYRAPANCTSNPKKGG